MNYMKSGVMLLMLSLSLLLSACSHTATVQCKPVMAPKWIMDPVSLESNLRKELFEALSE